jgi:hypothetical protein
VALYQHDRGRALLLEPEAGSRAQPPAALGAVPFKLPASARGESFVAAPGQLWWWEPNKQEVVRLRLVNAGVRSRALPFGSKV